MSILSSYIPFVLFALAAVLGDSNCDKFKTGRFIYVDDVYKGWVLTRDNEYQIEKHAELNVELKGRIEWKSDCEYELTYVEVSDVNSKSIIGKKIIGRITETNGRNYTVESIDGISKVKLAMKKIE